jgi:hypothetical protein
LFEKLRGGLRALLASLFAGGFLAAFAYAQPGPSAPNPASSGADASVPANQSWCERRFIAPLKTYSEFGEVKEWSPEKEKEAAAVTIYCAKDCADGGGKVGPAAGKGVADAGAPAAPSDEVTCDRLDDADADAPIVDGHGRPTAPPSTRRDRTSAGAIGSGAYVQDVGRFAKSQETVDVIIATVADPTDSGLQYYFDQQLEVLQLAIERDGLHVRDQSWLPWADTHASDDKVKGASEACRREVPGVVVFRPSALAQRQSALILLLVGETPTYGVQKAALARAIDFHRRVSGGKPLRIVGPTFSGSAESLRRTLDREWECDARVVSGSATSRETAVTMLSRHAGDPRRLEYELTTVPEDELQCAFLRREARIQGWWKPRPRADEIRVVRGLALLRESGTAFGTDRTKPNEERATYGDDVRRKLKFDCPYRPDLDLRFPLHISSVRDAYENIEEARARTARQGPLGVRQTTLDVSLEERAKPRDIQFEMSVKTPLARDLVLTQLLGTVARENIRFVAIQATDSADVVFLARKIRAVAPDVRLVIFGNDVLYTHPSMQADLLGSFIVTPYPFFGSNDFAKSIHKVPSKPSWYQWFWFTPPEPDENPPEHIPFASALAEGTYNATLAVRARRGGSTSALAEYNFFTKKDPDVKGPPPPPIPVWISAIAAGGVAPVAVSRPRNCGSLIFGRGQDPVEKELCADAAHGNDEARSLLALRTYALRVEPDVTPPNFWQFVFATVMLLAFFDSVQGRVARRAMKYKKTTSPDGLASGERGLDDRGLDLALMRVTYLLYAALRRQFLFAALLTMLVIQTLAIATYGDQLVSRKFPILLLLVGAAATTTSAYGVFSSWRRHFARRRALRKELRRRAQESEAVSEAEAIPRIVRALWRPLAIHLGFNPPTSAPAVIKHTLNQLRFLGLLAVAISLPLLGLFVAEMEELDPEPFSAIAIGKATNPNVAMFVLRVLPLVNRVSPAAPILMGLLVCYLWACGRSGRLRMLHAVAVMTPSEGARDATCTPLTHVLHDDRPGEGTAMRAAERTLAESIKRPSHRATFFFAMVGATFFPLVAFALKPPTTLENWKLSIVLVSMLAVGAVVIVATLVQLWLYWRSFSRLLDRIQTHAIAESFAGVPGPLKESLDSQVSRRRDDALRFAACVRRFRELILTRPNVKTALPHAFQTDEWEGRLERMETALVQMQAPRPFGWTTSEIEEGGPVGRELIQTAAAVRAGLEQVWQGNWEKARLGVMRPTKTEGARDPSEQVDAMTRFDTLGDDKEAAVAWLRRAHSFVAAVVTLILNRHVRQFRMFLYTMTGAALCLLMALSSYAFQPRRLLLTCIWTIMGAVVVSCAAVYIQLDRDAVLSRIAGTTPGHLDVTPAFVARVVGWVGIPLLSVAAAQYPDLATKLFSWTEPLINALK